MNVTRLSVQRKTRRDAIRNETSREVGIKNEIELDEKRLQWSAHEK
jgi:hypothetical protein